MRMSRQRRGRTDGAPRIRCGASTPFSPKTSATAFLQAYDKATGELLASVEVDRSLHSSPMTYMHEGRQYILVAGGGRGEPSELIAFALPK